MYLAASSWMKKPPYATPPSTYQPTPSTLGGLSTTRNGLRHDSDDSSSEQETPIRNLTFDFNDNTSNKFANFDLMQHVLNQIQTIISL